MIFPPHWPLFPTPHVVIGQELDLILHKAQGALVNHGRRQDRGFPLSWRCAWSWEVWWYDTPSSPSETTHRSLGVFRPWFPLR